MGRVDPSYHYDVNLTLGIVVFVVGLLVEPKLRPVRWIGHLADRSYSLYLLHGLLAVVVMNALYPTIGYPGALVAGLVVTAVGIEAGYRLVERPCMRLARHVAGRSTPLS
jgi:peptidoglycan/LPS O-acetylase OafA/YrhL